MSGRGFSTPLAKLAKIIFPWSRAVDGRECGLGQVSVARLYLPEFVFLVRVLGSHKGRGLWCCWVLPNNLRLVYQVDLSLQATSLRVRVRRLVGAAVATPLTRPRTWLGSFALQRIPLLRKPLLLDRVGPQLMKVVAVREVDALLDG